MGSVRILVLIAALACALGGACAETPRTTEMNARSSSTSRSGGTSSDAGAHAASAFVISIIGTNDLHGHFEHLPELGGFVSALRARVGDDHVLLVDAGDMFQGTLESNIGEGAAIVRAYDALHYDAAAIGNHEFDFGPVGPSPMARTPEDDPRGALRARAEQARFPFLVANVLDAGTGKPPAWRNVLPSVIIEKHGARIGIIGVTSIDTPHTTLSVNFAGLGIVPLAEAINKEAASLRQRGAEIVIVSAHAGGKCKNVKDPGADGQCEPHHEIMHVLKDIPAGTIDALIAGHTHAGMATKIGGVPIIESFANGRAFGRIDLEFDPQTRKVIASKVFPTQDVALPATYEGVEIAASPEIAQTFAEDVERARPTKERKLGVKLENKIHRSFDHECSEGNLFADLMLASHPKANIAITNGGSLRTDLGPGDLTYGALFEAMPFDNRFAVLQIDGAQLRHVLEVNAKGEHAVLSLAGVFAEASCKDGKLDIGIFHRTPKGGRGALVADAEKLTLVTSDFLALGGDTAGLPKEHVLEDTFVRDALEKGLTGRGVLREQEVFDPTHPRWKLPSERPVRCTP